MRVLVAFEYSGEVRSAFSALGHDAWSCDLLETASSGNHIIGDARDVIKRGSWDLLIAHPPCTFLANSGVRWLYNADKTPNIERWFKMTQSVLLFNEVLRSDIPKICVENPIMHGYAQRIIARKYDEIISPHQFGEPATKATCLWLKNLPPLLYTSLHLNPLKNWAEKKRGSHTGHSRSKTFHNIALAMAHQWSSQ